jgi:hypothetical protein
MSIPDNADEQVAEALFSSALNGIPDQEERNHQFRGPNKLAEDAAALIAELLPLRDAAKTKRERKQLSSRIKSARILLQWAKSRAGYRAG